MSIKLTSWNVNGIRAVNKKPEFWNWFNNSKADIINLQEIRANIDDIPADLYNIDGYNSYFTTAEKKGYSGVATYSKVKPVNVFHGLGDIELDMEGRLLRSDFEDFTLLNIYFPNSGTRGAKLDKKIKFCNTLTNYIIDLKDAGRSIVISGDVNIAHEPIDLKNPEKNHENSGFLPAERDWLSEFLDLGFIDTFRELHPTEEKYSWWSYRYHARSKGIGWRLDYFFVSEDLKDKVLSATIEDNVMGSDHCPVTLELDF
ncbi:MAG: exodeoxyribonuclease III [Methanobrevibacter sp.]|uniref:exodeoxyribonuclease III n=1 Tax=Methanobrevibacter sp. TaxID=66852 RepID=UPI0026DFA97B|nr:exodeoxyribonuclease III [Methanobrevibacter sp.]MDO5848709.1 exodeoxyribonuclease III [Methanobrevibacter sp.]